MAENVPKRASDQLIELDNDLLSIPEPPPITTVPKGPVDWYMSPFSNLTIVDAAIPNVQRMKSPNARIQ
jgi:hypothetical protein